MRISDWSSDVCASDLLATQRAGALLTTSCSQPFSARTATVPPMQARDAPSLRALLCPGGLTGSSVGNALVGAGWVAAIVACAEVAAAASGRSSFPAAAASTAPPGGSAASSPPNSAAPRALAISTPSVTASSIGRKNDHGVSALNSSRFIDQIGRASCRERVCQYV